jgi:hypothetical protein
MAYLYHPKTVFLEIYKHTNFISGLLHIDFLEVPLKSRKTEHQQNVQHLLRILMLSGTGTTWDMAKVMVLNDILRIRTREKNYRRLLIGRVDRMP